MVQALGPVCAVSVGRQKKRLDYDEELVGVAILNVRAHMEGHTTGERPEVIAEDDDGPGH